MTDQLDAEAWETYMSALIDGGCKTLFVTQHFGKPYVYMIGPDGKQFIERIPDELVEQELERQKSA